MFSHKQKISSNCQHCNILLLRCCADFNVYRTNLSINMKALKPNNMSVITCKARTCVKYFQTAVETVHVSV